MNKTYIGMVKNKIRVLDVEEGCICGNEAEKMRNNKRKG